MCGQNVLLLSYVIYASVRSKKLKVAQNNSNCQYKRYL